MVTSRRSWTPPALDSIEESLLDSITLPPTDWISRMRSGGCQEHELPKGIRPQATQAIGKYLLGCPRLVSEFNYQAMVSVITTFTDSDWAGCPRSAKSTIGGAVRIGEHVT